MTEKADLAVLKSRLTELLSADEAKQLDALFTRLEMERDAYRDRRKVRVRQ